MVLNRFGVIGVGPEIIVDVDTVATVNFPRPHIDGMAVVGTLDPKEVVGTGGQVRATPTTLQDGLGNGNGWQNLVLVPTGDGARGDTLNEVLAVSVVAEV